MELGAVVEKARELGPMTYLASVTPEDDPHVTPVVIGWEGDRAWTMVGAASQKATNLRRNPSGLLHFPTTERLESLMIWGSASIHDDVATKRRLWDGVFDYDLNAFAAGGPDGSPDAVFIALTPNRALLVSETGHRERWRR